MCPNLPMALCLSQMSTTDGHQASPVCPNLPLCLLAAALCLSQVSTTKAIGPSICAVTHDVVRVPCAHHPWYQVPTARGIKPPPSPASDIDPVAWGAMLEDDRLTWPPPEVGCPPFRCQEPHLVPAPTLSLPPLCHII